MNAVEEAAGRKGWNWRRYLLFGAPITGAAVLFVAGIVFWGGFNTAMEATNTLGFCTSCHEMRDTVYQEYRHTIHFQNRTGVRAVCSDCHVPDPWIHKFIRKIKASRELYHKVMGTISTPEKFEERRLELAMNVWAAMKETDSRECRNCHTLESMAPRFQRPRARQQHLNAMQTGQTCIDCHKGIAHKDVRNLLSDEQIEELEKPVVAYIRDIPQTYLDGLAYVEKADAEAAAKAESEARAAEAAVQARIEAAVDKALADAQAQAAQDAGQGQAVAGTPPASGGAVSGSVAANIDWTGVNPTTVTLFYPGQASFEWVQIGKNHGGARPFTKGGDRCSTCHAKELPAMGSKIVTGTKLEPTPIPGKRESIDVALQAAHDGENLYLRFQWQNGPHNPVPFVDGGKMDPDNPIKLAMMIAGTGIDRVDQAGCWATCHNDNRYMPDAPDAAAIDALKEVADRLHIEDGVTKYLSESRTEIELKGRDGKPLGGWDKLKPESEMADLLAAGTFMDLLRVDSAGNANNGHLLERRVAGSGGPVAAQASLDGDVWTVLLSRPLAAGAAGDVAIEPGKTYTVGFAIHDDYTVARFHHVSLEHTFGIDNADAEINAVQK